MARMAALLVASGLYAGFVVSEPGRLHTQRFWIQRSGFLLREHFGLANLPNSNNYNNNQGDKGGGKATAGLWLVLLGLTICGLAHDRQFALAAHYLPLVPMFAWGMYFDCPFSAMTVFSRIALCILVVLGMVQPEVYFSAPSIIIRCAVLFRTATVLVFIESLEDGLFHLLALSVLIQCCSSVPELALLPLNCFVLVVFPWRVLGISDRVSDLAQGWWKVHYAQRLRDLGLILVPSLIVTMAFCDFASNEFYMVVGLMTLVSGMILRIPFLAVWANHFIAPHTLEFRKLGRLYSVTDHAISIFMALAGLYLWWRDYQMIFLIYVSLGIFAVLRKNLPYNQAQSKIWIVIGLGMGLEYKQPWLCRHLLFFGALASFLCLLMARAEDAIFSQIACEDEAEFFLSHANKQRFASVGATVELLLRTNSTRRHCQLLRSAQLECRMGYARCLASNIYRKLNQGEPRPSLFSLPHKPAYTEITSTTMAELLITSKTTFTCYGNGENKWEHDWLVRLDWELLHLVLTDFARMGLRLDRVTLDHAEQRLILVTNVPLPPTSNVILMRLVAYLGKMVVGSTELIMSVHIASSLPSSPQSQIPSQLLLHQDRCRHLCRLRFAMVDDNALIRKNFERLMHRNLGVPLANLFIYGATLEETKLFPQRLMESSVDVAIFDQNLDFDEEFLKGSELASEAKRLGFTGCLVLHSSDIKIAELMATGVFHGGVGKTADSAQFIDGLVNVHNRFEQQQ
ncbi:hypothetical protein BASA81_003233 [Batrachochytrium salamandrivorans]|nr:hypothetical protein BASA81_003233 [Batrachochytrium salamandrivorans]